MNAYDQKVAARLEAEKAAEEEKDEEGWTTVTGRKKRGQFALARKESTIQKVQFKEEIKKHKKQLQNFYTFQIREAKKQSKFHVVNKKSDSVVFGNIFNISHLFQIWQICERNLNLIRKSWNRSNQNENSNHFKICIKIKSYYTRLINKNLYV